MASHAFRLESDYADVIAATLPQHRLENIDLLARAIEAAPRAHQPVHFSTLDTSSAFNCWKTEISSAPAELFSVESTEFLKYSHLLFVIHGTSSTLELGALLPIEPVTPALDDISSQVDEIERAILALNDMPRDWDGRNGAAPSTTVTKRAIRAVKEMRAYQIHDDPKITVSGDGEVDLIWEAGEFAASLSFLDNGTVYGYAFGPGMEQAWELTSTIYPTARIVELAALLVSNLKVTDASRVDRPGR